MNNLDNTQQPEADGASSAVRRRNGGTFVAWAVILLLTALVAGAPTPTPDPAPVPDRDRLRGATLTLHAQYLVGTASMADEQKVEPVRRQVEAWRPESAWEQTRVAVVTGELVGPQAALERLDAIDAPRARGEPAQDDPDARDMLLRLYGDYAAERLDAPSVTDTERERLRERLGWFGGLALAPPGAGTPLREQVIAEARRTFYTVVGAVVVLGALGLAGFVVLVVVMAKLFTGASSALQPAPERSGVYAEAFACWLALFVGLSLVGGLFLGREAGAAIGFLPMIGSLAAFAWPVVRGVSWEKLREDIGWTRDHRWGRELAAGVGGYAMAIPLVLLLLAVTTFVLGFVNAGGEPGSAPAHPAAESLALGTWWQRVQLLLLACVVAPIVEEGAFRGLLYRHLRNATGTMRRGSSILLSAIVSSVLFALLHPQGLLAVPALTGVSLALTFTREWRNTLVSPIIAHALNNAVVMAMVLTVANN